MRKIPPEIERIFDKPGGEWADTERDRIIEWLFEDEQLKRFLSIGLMRLRRLAHQATYQDAQDAWHDFYEKRLKKVIQNYDPQKNRHEKKEERFPSFLLFCFKRFCNKAGEKLRKYYNRNQSLDKLKDNQGSTKGTIDEPKLVDKPRELQKIVPSRSRYEAFSECRNKLTPALQEAVTLYYDEGLSIKEVAEELGITEGAVKVRLYRARLLLNKCMKRKGW